MPNQVLPITLQAGGDLRELTLIHAVPGGKELALYSSWAQIGGGGKATFSGPDSEVWAVHARGEKSYQSDSFSFGPAATDTAIEASVSYGTNGVWSFTLTAQPSGTTTTVAMPQVDLVDVHDHVVVIRVTGDPANGTAYMSADPPREYINLTQGDVVWFSLDSFGDLVDWTPGTGVVFKDIDTDNPANTWLQSDPSALNSINGILGQATPTAAAHQTEQDPGCGWNSGTTIVTSDLNESQLANPLDGNSLAVNFAIRVHSKADPSKTQSWDPELDLNMPGEN